MTLKININEVFKYSLHENLDIHDNSKQYHIVLWICPRRYIYIERYGNGRNLYLVEFSHLRYNI